MLYTFNFSLWGTNVELSDTAVKMLPVHIRGKFRHEAWICYEEASQAEPAPSDFNPLGIPTYPRCHQNRVQVHSLVLGFNVHIYFINPWNDNAREAKPRTRLDIDINVAITLVFSYSTQLCGPSISGRKKNPLSLKLQHKQEVWIFEVILCEASSL